MVPSSILTIITVFRVTLNLPDLPFSIDLRKNSTAGFLSESQKIVDAFDFLFLDEPLYKNASVHTFRFRQPLGSRIPFIIRRLIINNFCHSSDSHS
jgi:hypothetical protein